MLSSAVWMFECVDVMVMSSAYVMTLTGGCGVGMSEVYMLKRTGERTPPWGTPVLNWRFVDVVFLNVVYMLCVL